MVVGEHGYHLDTMDNEYHNFIFSIHGILQDVFHTEYDIDLYPFSVLADKHW